MKLKNINFSSQLFLRLPNLLLLCFITLVHMARARESHIILFMQEAGNCRNMIGNHTEDNVMSCFNNATRLTPSNYLIGEVFESASDLYHKAKETKLATHYQRLSANKRILAIMDQDLEVDYIKQAINVLIDQKDEGKETQTHQVCSLAINLFYVLMIYLKPVLPETARKVEAFLNCESLTWQSLQSPLLNHAIQEFKPLLTRIEQKHIEALIEQTKQDLIA